jgi:integrase/recombinase XerD
MDDPTMTLWRYDWLQSNRSAATIDEYQRQLRHFAGWLSKPPESACRADCASYVLLRREISATSALLTWKALRCYYRFLQTVDPDADDPMRAIKAPRVPEPATKGVAPDDMRRLLAVCTGSDLEAVRDRAIIQVLACTGLRRTEMITLRLDDVNVEQRLLLVRTSKTGKPRVVPISTDATMALLKYLRLRSRSTFACSSDSLWLGAKGSLGPSGLRLMLVRRSTCADVSVTAHQFRRSFAVDWLSSGGSQTSLMAICGWSSPAMPARYTRHAAERVAADEYRRIFK